MLAASPIYTVPYYIITHAAAVHTQAKPIRNSSTLFNSMAASSPFTTFFSVTFFLFLLLPLTHTILTPPTGKPVTVILPARKDAATGLQLTTLKVGTPQISILLLLDINGPLLSTICRHNKNSTTFISPFCRSTVCVSTGIRHSCRKCNDKQDCRKSACVVVSKNPMTRKYAASELGQDTVSFYFINRDKRGSGWDDIPNFLFACAPQSFRRGPFPDAAEGVVGLGHTTVALPTQIASRLGSPPEFTICLGSDAASGGGGGGVFFGGVPFQLPKDTVYAPLTIGTRGEYSISVKSIRINNQPLPSAGPWTAVISTTAPYTILPPALYPNFTQFFADQLTGVPRVEPIPPFGMCFDARILPPTRVGSPNIEFFLTEKVRWVFLGVDALVRLRPNVACLAFVNGGESNLGASPSAITIGLNQLEEKFVQFDLVRSRIGFVPSRLSQPFTCSGLNYFNASSEITVMGD